MLKTTEALRYWNNYVKCKETYQTIKGTSELDLADKNLLLEIMVGNLLGFIEEICKGEK